MGLRRPVAIHPPNSPTPRKPRLPLHRRHQRPHPTRSKALAPGAERHRAGQLAAQHLRAFAVPKTHPPDCLQRHQLMRLRFLLGGNRTAIHARDGRLVERRDVDPVDGLHAALHRAHFRQTRHEARALTCHDPRHVVLADERFALHPMRTDHIEQTLAPRQPGAGGQVVVTHIDDAGKRRANRQLIDLGAKAVDRLARSIPTPFQGDAFLPQAVVERLLLDFPSQQRLVRLRGLQLVREIGRHQHGENLPRLHRLAVAHRRRRGGQIARLDRIQPLRLLRSKHRGRTNTGMPRQHKKAQQHGGKQHTAARLTLPAQLRAAPPARRRFAQHRPHDKPAELDAKQRHAQHLEESVVHHKRDRKKHHQPIQPRRKRKADQKASPRRRARLRLRIAETE